MPLQQKRLAQFSLAAVLLFLVLMFGTSLFDHLFEKPRLTPRLQNVYENSLTDEWAYLRGTLHMSDRSTLLDFHVDYEPTGKVIELQWQFGEVGENGTYTIYNVWLTPDMKQYQLSVNQQEHMMPGQFLNATELNRLLTPSVFKAITPHDNPAFYRVQFNPQYVSSDQSTPNAPTDTRELNGGRITGPLQQGQGFFIDVFANYQTSPSGYESHSPARFLLTYPQ